jgi:hypothetical protein
MDDNTDELIRVLKEGGFPEFTLEGDARVDYKKQPLLLVPLLFSILYLPLIIITALIVYFVAQFYNSVYKLLRVERK